MISYKYIKISCFCLIVMKIVAFQRLFNVAYAQCHIFGVLGNDFLGRSNLTFWILVLDDVFACVSALWEDPTYRLHSDWRSRSGALYKWPGQ